MPNISKHVPIKNHQISFSFNAITQLANINLQPHQLGIRDSNYKRAIWIISFFGADMLDLFSPIGTKKIKSQAIAIFIYDI